MAFLSECTEGKKQSIIHIPAKRQEVRIKQQTYEEFDAVINFELGLVRFGVDVVALRGKNISCVFQGWLKDWEKSQARKMRQSVRHIL